MSENGANPADVQQQEQTSDGALRETTHRAGMPLDANEADVLEQAIEVPEDDEDHRG